MEILNLLSIKEICDYLEAEFIGDKTLLGAHFPRLVTDSRKCNESTIFLAIVGENFDAHDFLNNVWSQGCRFAVIERNLSIPDNKAALRVNSTVEAFGKIAQLIIERKRNLDSDFKIYAITGSNGKTSTKEMLSTILEASGKKVLKTSGNFNNQIGLPITVMGLREDHDVAVLEMGTNAPGEIKYLVDLVQPECAILTGVADAHLQAFINREGVARAKGEIFTAKGLKTAVLLASDLHYFQNVIPENVEIRALGSENVFVDNIRSSIEGLSFDFVQGNVRTSLQINVLGKHNAKNLALSLLAVGIENLSKTTFVDFKKLLTLPRGRLELIRDIRYPILYDAYNANPSSMRAAFEIMQEIASVSQRCFIIGEMAELGLESLRMHYEVGKLLANTGGRAALIVGEEEASEIARGAREAGFDSEQLIQCSGSRLNEGLESLSRLLDEDCLCLVKGSRRMALERVLSIWSV